MGILDDIKKVKHSGERNLAPGSWMLTISDGVFQCWLYHNGLDAGFIDGDVALRERIIEYYELENRTFS